MSDQVSGPLGWMLIFVSLLVYFTGAPLTWLFGGHTSWEEWLIPMLFCALPVYLGGYLLSHPYWWWPTHVQDRVARIAELFDEPDDGNPPGGKT